MILAALMSALITAGSWAVGLGAQFNANISLESGFIPGWAIALSPRDNLHFSGFWDFDHGGESIFGLTADLWLLNPAIVRFGSSGALGIFLGPGLYASFTTAGDGTFNFGVRVPIGVNLRVLDRMLELFLQAAPSWGLALFPKPALGDPSIPVSLGLRVWF